MASKKFSVWVEQEPDRAERIRASRPERAARKFLNGMKSGNYIVRVVDEENHVYDFVCDVILKPNISVRAIS